MGQIKLDLNVAPLEWKPSPSSSLAYEAERGSLLFEIRKWIDHERGHVFYVLTVPWELSKKGRGGHLQLRFEHDMESEARVHAQKLLEEYIEELIHQSSPKNPSRTIEVSGIDPGRLTTITLPEGWYHVAYGQVRRNDKWYTLPNGEWRTVDPCDYGMQAHKYIAVIRKETTPV